MAATEVTNQKYRLFLTDLERNGQSELLAKAQVQQENWNSIDGFNAPLADNYFSHPAYADYPVVNISFEAAQAYCQWLTQKLNSYYPEAQISVRLPMPQEWSYAAKGGRKSAPYPWGGAYVQNAKGCYLANFSPKQADDGCRYTVRADAYFANGYGLYNTVGNVAEMTNEPGIAMGGSWQTTSMEGITVDSQESYEQAAPTLGFRPLISLQGNTSNLNLNKAWKKISKDIL
jgi:formylglycine-generating enzyme required for sulfatase activity